MIIPFVTLAGKTVRTIARLRGGGSALPGLFIEKIDPQFAKRALSSLPKGVVIISGTNGKTTTTKIVVELLESQGLSVFTNRTGSNFVRGVIAALLEKVDNHGRLHADIAVLELDEAHAVHFVKHITPRHSLILNVMRDQLDRFSEVDTTASLLSQIAAATTETVVLNASDSRVAAIADNAGNNKSYRFFGVSPEIAHHFPDDDHLHSSIQPTPKEAHTLDVQLSAVSNHTVTYTIDGKRHTVELQLRGAYNALNAAAALVLVRNIIGTKAHANRLLDTLSGILPAFGRGETVVVNGKPIEFVLVKNPSGFRLALASYSHDNTAIMIAINDNYADGRDMSWLWDVDFSCLCINGVQQISGLRAYDMALRLQYDRVRVEHITVDLPVALHEFMGTHASKAKRIYCTYTAMLALRKELSKVTALDGAL